MTRIVLGSLAVAAFIVAALLHGDRKARAAERPDPAEVTRLHRDDMRREMDWNCRLPLHQEAERWLDAVDRELFGKGRGVWRTR